jgi:hypothetical protein
MCAAFRHHESVLVFLLRSAFHSAQQSRPAARKSIGLFSFRTFPPQRNANIMVILGSACSCAPARLFEEHNWLERNEVAMWPPTVAGVETNHETVVGKLGL